MKKCLKLTLFINACLFCFNVSAIQADTLKQKTTVCFGLKYGISVFNNLKLGDISGNGDEYSVNSNPKGYFELNLSLIHKKNNFELGFSLIQTSFSGHSHSIGAGRYNGLRYQYYYNIYQKIDYNVYYLLLGYGRDIHVRKKHIICPSINLFVPVIYQFKIDNNYDAQQIYDTTLFSLTKNATNDDTNSGYFPRLNLGLAYKYNPTDRIGIVFGVSCFYGLSYASKKPDPVKYSSVFNNGNNYCYIAYDIRKQLVLICSLGINIKLNPK